MLTLAPSFARVLPFPSRSAFVAYSPMRVERRFKSRYPMELAVRFRPVSGSLFQGAGRTVNLSSGGVLVLSQDAISEDELSVGTLLEMRIEWPSLLNGEVPLQLIAVGRVVRRRAAGFAATFEQYKFRTASSIQPSPGLE